MKIVKACVASLVTLSCVTPALAQVTYRDGYRQEGGRHHRVAPPLNADEDLSYATRPSFQIFDTPYGPQTRVIYRCAYPNGWNATDFIRDINGTPAGINHTCPEADEANSRVRARY